MAGTIAVVAVFLLVLGLAFSYSAGSAYARQFDGELGAARRRGRLYMDAMRLISGDRASRGDSPRVPAGLLRPIVGLHP